MDRTTPEYPTQGPGDGRTWHEFFREVRGRDEADQPADADDSDADDLPGAITVTNEAHEYDGAIPRGLSTWRNRLLANDYEVKIGHSAAWHADSYYKNGNLKKAAHMQEQIWLNAWDGVRYVTVSYNLVEGKPVSGRTVRQVRGVGRNLSDAELKEIVEW